MICIIVFKDGSKIRIGGFINEWSAFVIRRIIESNPEISHIIWDKEN